ncbi:MAG: dihydrolipoyl dehydrogenase [Lentisphaeria bacterium]|nr:dihydrolipoyl dehydrogenase [Lentisphaeria bacterium]
MYDLMVIGAGPGGYEAAAYAAKHFGKKVVLFEKQELGGTCLNVGCIPTKTFMRSIKTLEECEEAKTYGIVTEGAAKLDMAAVQARKQKVVGQLVKGVAAMEKGAGVEVVKATAKIVGIGKVEADGKLYEGANILIATGSVPACPPIPGLRDNPLVLDSTGILALDKLPKALVVIGGGVIGLEFANFFHSAGTDVTIVEMMPKIAPVVDDEIGQQLHKELVRSGIKINLNCKVVKIEGSTLFYLDPDGKEQQVTGDYVLNSTGRRAILPEGIEALKMDTTRKGIVTDDFGKTSVSGIWACGDVTGRCLLAHAATREGIVAVNNMSGDADRMRYKARPSVSFTHPAGTQVGATEQELKAKGIAYRKVVQPMAMAGRFMVDYAGKNGTVKVLVSEKYGQILGVHAIGGCAGEFICAASTWVANEMTVDTVLRTIFPHPTVSESIREAAIHA